VLFVAFIYLSFNLHSKAPYNSYQHVIWADAAGYHMYQPGLFLYGFEQENFPEQSVEMAGNGFCNQIHLWSFITPGALFSDCTWRR